MLRGVDTTVTTNVTGAEDPSGDVSEVVGLYQNMFRRILEHFFPNATLQQVGSEPIPGRERLPYRRNYRLKDLDGGLAMEVTYFNARYIFRPGFKRGFLQSERRLLETISRVMDLRFRTLFGVAAPERARVLQYGPEDHIVTEFLNPVAPTRVPAALEVLRATGLSTYENRDVSTGVLLLGTDGDPAAPDREKPPGLPPYNIRLTLLKGIYRICDGLRTLFLVDREGDVRGPADIERWTERVQGEAPLRYPVPRDFESHARATLLGGHICMVLMPTHEIKVFSGGTWMFSFSNARWRLLDIPAKFALWNQAVGTARPADLAARLFAAAMNLAEDRKGALFLILRDPEAALEHIVDPGDRLGYTTGDQLQDPENVLSRPMKQVLHLLVQNRSVDEINDTVLESLAAMDGAMVVGLDGQLFTFGAILKVPVQSVPATQVMEGARTTTARAVSHYGPVLKVSEDGLLTMFDNGERIWDI